MEELPRESEENPDVDKILDEIAAAAGNALTFEHFEYRQKKEDRLAKRMMAGGRLSAEEKKFLSDENRSNEVRFPSLEAMKESFTRLGLSRELIEETVKHEEAHFKAAEEEGLNPCFLVRFYKTEDGLIAFVPAVKVALKEGEQKAQEVRDGLKKIGRAPSTPSKSDIRKTEK